MNSDLSAKAKNDFEKDFFKIMNDSQFRKTMENVRKHRDIKLVTTNRGRSNLLSQIKYDIKKWFSKNLLAIEMKCV